MTRNADNKTTLLESLSKLKMAGKLRFWRGAIEIPEDELRAICDEIQAEHEQAIAATMGGQRSTVEIAELLDEFEHECYMLRVEASETRARDDVVRESYERIRDEFAGRIAATVGNGTLTAEQVREAIERHSAWVIGNNRCFHDGAYEAIADELNAELDKGENGECYLVHEGKKYPAELDFGFLGMMPITITVGGFRYLAEVPNGE